MLTSIFAISSIALAKQKMSNKLHVNYDKKALGVEEGDKKVVLRVEISYLSTSSLDMSFP